MQGANVAGFKSWIAESRKVEPLTGDKDVFGDDSVIVLRMPGHTPGHSCLLVRLKEMGPVLLTGDLVYFRENYESGGVPSFNFDRAATVASIERIEADRREAEGDRRHTARPARHRQAAGVPGGREVTPKPCDGLDIGYGLYPPAATRPRSRCASLRAVSIVHGCPWGPIVKRRTRPPVRYWTT